VFKYPYRWRPSGKVSKVGLSLVSLVVVSTIVANREQSVLSNQIDSDPYSYTIALKEPRIDNHQVPKNSIDFNSTQESVLLSKGDRITAAIHGNQGNNFVSEVQPNPTDSFALKSTTKTALLPQTQTFTTPNNYPQADGVYLYGQSPEPGQNGQGYVVFEKQKNQVVGALYMPNSEYSCFYGTVDNSGELAMTVNGSQMNGTSNEVASGSTESSLDDPNQPTNYAYNLALRDYHRLASVSERDRQMLQTCR
jgi:hypothetical protein